MKNKYTILLVLCCALCICCDVQDMYAQKARGANGFPKARFIRKTFGISYSVPEGFRFCWEHGVLNVHEKTDIGMFYFSLESDDAQCKLFLPEYPMYFSHIISPGYFHNSDLSHRSGMLGELRDILEVENIDPGNYITAVAGKAARDRFNADSVFTFSVPNFVPIADIPQYEYCTRMYISRKGRPMLQLIWLFTREGKKNEEQYIRQLDGRVRYDDDGKWTPHDLYDRERKYGKVLNSGIFKGRKLILHPPGPRTMPGNDE